MSTQSSSELTALKERVDNLYLEYIFPVLATVRIGEDPEAVAFEKTLLEAAKATGVKVRRYIFPLGDVTAPEMEELLRQAGADFLLSAILLERPLPQDWDASALDARIPLQKRLPQPPDGSLASAAALLQSVIDAAEGSAR